jgi:hypothetical protein
VDVKRITQPPFFQDEERFRTIQICLNVMSVAPLLGGLDLAQLRTIARAYGTLDRSGTFLPKDLQQ